MVQPKLAVVTISFNQGQYIERCINSVLEQSYTNLSYAVVDAGSTDNTLEILGAVSDPRLKWISERDRGPADGLNKGFQIAAGDICCYVNADDAFLPGALATIVEEFARHPADDVIYGNGVQIDQNGQPVRYLIATRWNLRAYALGRCNVIQPSTFFRRAAFDKAGGFNIDNHVIWDTELLIDMALAGSRCKHIRSLLSTFRIHAQSITGTQRLRAEYERERVRLRNKVTAGASSKLIRAEKALYALLNCAASPEILANAFLVHFDVRPRLKFLSCRDAD
jgi:glycosyltransferase involved in cell wall biosynthesis